MKKVFSAPTRQIRRLLFTVAAAISCALLTSVFLVYYYGPSGNYRAKNVLLSPLTLETLSYNDKNPITGGNSRFILKEIRLERGKEEKRIGEEVYSNFYKKVEDLKSIPANEEIAFYFLPNQKLITLSIVVKTADSAAWQEVTKVFQRIQFAENRALFRAELREEGSEEQWAYFQYPEAEKLVNE